MERAKKAIGWGITIYALMYLVWSGLVVHGLSFGYTSLIVRVFALALVTSLAVRSMRLVTRADVLPFALLWVIISVGMDAIFLVPFTGWALYAEWSVWVGYSLVVIFPMIAVSLRAQSAPLS